jgi:transposase-like protein
MEERMRHAAAAVASGKPLRVYAEENGLKLSTVGYWVKQFRSSEKPAKKTLPARDELTDARNEITSLLSVRDELIGQLEDAHTKIRALQNVIVILGHQVGDE